MSKLNDLPSILDDLKERDLGIIMKNGLSPLEEMVEENARLKKELSTLTEAVATLVTQLEVAAGALKEGLKQGKIGEEREGT